MTEAVTLQGILQRHLGDYRQTHTLDARRLAVCRHVTECRTAALGGLQLQCEHCGDDPVHWFSCRDRHCPQCQQHKTQHAKGNSPAKGNITGFGFKFRFGSFF